MEVEPEGGKDGLKVLGVLRFRLNQSRNIYAFQTLPGNKLALYTLNPKLVSTRPTLQARLCGLKPKPWGSQATNDTAYSRAMEPALEPQPETVSEQSVSRGML